MKGDENPFTTILDSAEEMVKELEVSLVEEYGLPLYTEEQGDKPVWPADPELMSPEEMQVLIDTRGEQAVNQWLEAFYRAQAVAEPEEFV